MKQFFSSQYKRQLWFIGVIWTDWRRGSESTIEPLNCVLLIADLLNDSTTILVPSGHVRPPANIRLLEVLLEVGVRLGMARRTKMTAAPTAERDSSRPRRTSVTKASCSEDKYEYRFDRVRESELADCLCWESIRELCHLHGQPVPAPWRGLDAASKRHFRTFQAIDAAYVAPVDYPFSHGNPVMVDGRKLISVELVNLPSVNVNWDCTDKELLDGLRSRLKLWLKEQRATNPNARYFSAKAKLGTRQNLLKRLADLAIYRLNRCGCSEDDIDSAMQDFYRKLDPEAAQKADERGVLVKSGKVGNRNLPHTIDRAGKALRTFERQFADFIGGEKMRKTLRSLLGSPA